ncbi:MAG: glycosyltransferase family 1 protein [Chloroflexota bacterium]
MLEVGLGGLMLDYPHSGSAVYSTNLARHLPQAAPDLSFRLFVRSGLIGEDFPVVVERLISPLARFNHGSGVGARADKLAWEIASLPVASARRREVLLHSLYFAAPVVSKAPLIVTVHDLIPLVMPGYHRSAQSAMYSRFMAWAVQRAAAIITVSYHARTDILRMFRVPEDRVWVTYEAVDDRFKPGIDSGEVEALRARYRLPHRFILYIGGAERRKNLEMLVHAWALAAKTMRRLEVKLVVVAEFPPPDALYLDIPGLIHSLGLESDTIIIPRISEADKPALYRTALALAFPSTYEGFGFTPLEAMASGTPVVVSNATSLPEVVGQGGLLLDPGDAPVWSEALVNLVESEKTRNDLRARGLESASRFSWRATAEETAAVYRHVLR